MVDGQANARIAEQEKPAIETVVDSLMRTGAERIGTSGLSDPTRKLAGAVAEVMSLRSAGRAHPQEARR